MTESRFVSRPTTQMSLPQEATLQTVEPTEIMQKIASRNQELSQEIENLSAGIGKIIERHELDFLQAYNIFVKRKEKELKDFVVEMEKRQDSRAQIDAKMAKLHAEIVKKEQAVFSAEKMNDLMRERVRQKEQESKVLKEENEFFHRSALDSKKKFKLSQIALRRVEQECARLKAEND